MSRRLLVMMMVTGAYLLVSCSGKDKDAFEVTGSVKNSKSANVFLQEIPMNGKPPVMIDSAKIENGKFTLKGIGKEEGLYQVALDAEPGVLIVNDEPEISIELDMSKKNDFYTVKGSPASESLRKFVFGYTARQEDLQPLFMQVDSIQKSGASDSIVGLAVQKRETGIQEFNGFLKTTLKEEKSPSVSIFVLGMAARSMEPAELKTALTDISKKFPDHAGVKAVKETFEQQLLAFEKQQQAIKDNSMVGQQAPALSMPDVNGKNVTLADFKGKYVLVDFWASWCGPCRQENPNVVAAYNKYKGKNFTILGVSLDEDKAKWLEAVKADQLAWTHISDLKGWESAATTTYKFNGIPFNVLVDPSGKIVADNLRGDALDKKLAELLQ